MDPDVLAICELDCLDTYDNKAKLRVPGPNKKEAMDLIEFLKK